MITFLKIDDIDWIREDFDARHAIIKPAMGWKAYYRLKGWPEPTDNHGSPLRRAMNKADIEKKCAECGSTDNLDAHHIKPIKYKKFESGYWGPVHKGADNSASNGRWLCRDCHIVLHKKQRVFNRISKKKFAQITIS